MPTVNGRIYNDVLWRVAGQSLAEAFAGIQGVTEVFITEGLIIKEYNKLTRRLRTDFKRKGIPFNEENFVADHKIEGRPHIKVRFDFE